MYLYIGKVQVGPLSGYLWLLGNRLYLKLSWRRRDTYFLGNLTDPLSLAARLKRLMPRPVDVRKAAVQLAKALAAALYVARRCRDSPRWIDPRLGGRGGDIRRRLRAGVDMAGGP
jgi:hypothetical protein